MALKNKTHDVDRIAVIQRKPKHVRTEHQHEQLRDPAGALQQVVTNAPSTLRPADILTLQRTIGNRAVQRMLSNQPHTLRPQQSASSGVLQRQTEEEQPLQAKFETSPRTENRTAPTNNLKAGIENLSATAMDHVGVSSAATGNGLPESIRATMERSFATDFSNVRLHTDGGPEAAGVLAYTRGNDVHLRAGLLGEGRRGLGILGHELAHVVQQRQGRVAGAQPIGDGPAFTVDAALEREADDLGKRAARGEIVATSTLLAGASPSNAPVQPAVGFELELQVITSKKSVVANVTKDSLGTVAHDAPTPQWVNGTVEYRWDANSVRNVDGDGYTVVRPHDIGEGDPGRWEHDQNWGTRATHGTPENEFFDPGSDKSPIMNANGVRAVVDHMPGLANQLMAPGGHGAYGSILELVTAHQDEHAPADTFLGPMREAVRLAGLIKTQVIDARVRVSAATVLGADLRGNMYLGVDLGVDEHQFQNTDASVQATFGIRLDKVGAFMQSRRQNRSERTRNVYKEALTAMQNATATLTGLGITKAGAPMLWGYLELMATYLVGGRILDNVALDKNAVVLLVRDQFDLVAGAAIPNNEWGLLSNHIPAVGDALVAATQRARNENLLGSNLGSSAVTVDAWVNAALGGFLDPQWAKWGMAARVAPEQVGPHGGQVAAPVVEEREVRYALGERVAVNDWVPLATLYQQQMSVLNVPPPLPIQAPVLGVGGPIVNAPVQRTPLTVKPVKDQVVYLQDGRAGTVLSAPPSLNRVVVVIGNANVLVNDWHELLQ